MVSIGGKIIELPKMKFKPITNDGVMTLTFSKPMRFPAEWRKILDEDKEDLERMIASLDNEDSKRML